MPDQDWTFGLKPKQLDRLLSLGLEPGPAGSGPVEPLRPAEALIERPGGRVGRYRLRRVLGEGGMGIVYLAEQQEPVRREVALKIIRPGMDSQRVLARFEAEQQALALMEHPYIARVYDAGLAPSGRPYFVMEYIDGVPVTAYCDQHRLTVEERLHLFLHVCEAVQHAHQKGIVHRDLKPSNLLVALQDEKAVPKIIDFGVARAIDEPLVGRTLFTEQGQLLGTPEYMSPEQANAGNQDLDTRTDVYSLGVVLYELLAGLLPFEPQSFRAGGIERIRQILGEEEPPTPSTRLSKTSVERASASAQCRRTEARTLQRTLQGDLDWITLKALEKDRTRRYGTVDALATDIRNYLSHQPVSAAPPTTLYRARKFARRHGQGLAVATVAILLLIGGLATAIMYARVAQEHARAQSQEHRRLLADAEMLTGNKKYQAALAILDALLGSPHVGREARFAHAKILLARRDVKKRDLAGAIAELQTLRGGRDEVAGQAHFLLANIYYEGDPWEPGKTEEYQSQWNFHRRQAQELIAGTAAYYFLQAKAAHDGRTRLTYLDNALEIDPSHYDSLRERAQIRYAQRDYARAGEDASRMIGLRGGDPGGWSLRALARREQGRWAEAILDHDTALALAPQDAELYYERGQTHMQMGKYDLALADANRAAELDRTSLMYQVGTFMARAALGRYEQADEQYQRFGNRPLTKQELGSNFLFTIVPMNPKDFFNWAATEYFFQTRGWNRPPPPPPEEAGCGVFWRMREAAQYYDRLIGGSGRYLGPGSAPSWEPNGTRIAYMQGNYGITAIAVLDVKTGATELLTISGSNPAWSPDGRYVAFVRLRENLSLERVTSTTRAADRFVAENRPPSNKHEIWVIDLATRDRKLIAEGVGPAWSLDSQRIYFGSLQAEKPALWCVSRASDRPAPRQVFQGQGTLPPVISPNERYVVDAVYRHLRVFDLPSQQVVAEWIAPPIPFDLDFSWSPDSRALNIRGGMGERAGSWVLDIRTGMVRRMLPDAGIGVWSPDRSQMIVCPGYPYSGLWLFALDPNRPTAEALGDGQTVEVCCREAIAYYSRGVAADPNHIDSHLRRVDAALSIRDRNAPQYLEELEGALRRSPYHADTCIMRANLILSSPSELRDRLAPLSLLLARMAVLKDPNNEAFRETLNHALRVAAQPE